MKKCFAIISIILLFALLMGCGSSIDHAAQTVVDELVDQTANVVQSVDENVLFVKGGHPNSYPNISYGDAFEYYFGDPAWKSFKGTQEGPDEDGDGKPDYTIDDVDVVEFTGYCMYQDVRVKALIQFALDKEEGTFTSEYLSFNDVPQNMLMLGVIINNAFETYQNDHSVSASDKNIIEETDANETEMKDDASNNSKDILLSELEGRDVSELVERFGLAQKREDSKIVYYDSGIEVSENTEYSNYSIILLDSTYSLNGLRIGMSDEEIMEFLDNNGFTYWNGYPGDDNDYYSVYTNDKASDLCYTEQNGYVTELEFYWSN